VRFRLDTSWNKGMGFSADGRQLISASESGRIYYWDAHSGRLMRESSIGGVSMTAFEMSADRRTLAILGFEFVADAKRMDNVVQLWDVQAGQRRSEIRWTQALGEDAAALAFSSNGKYLVTGSTTGQLRVWDVASATELAAYDLGESQRIGALAFSPDGEQIAVGTLYETALWNWRSGESPHAIALQGPKRRGATSLAFSSSGEYLAIALHHGIQLVDVATEELVTALQDEPPGLLHVRQLVFSQDGRLLFAPNEANETSIVNGLLAWDVESGKLRYKLVSPSIRPRCVALSLDERLVAFAGNAEIAVFDLSNGMRLADHLQGHGDTVTGVRFVPGSGLIVTSGDDWTVRLWDAETGKQVRLMQHDSIVRALAVSADGRWIASSSLDDTVRVWEVVTGREARRLEGHGQLGGRRSLAFSPDSRRLYSWGDHDQALRVWDLATGESIAEQPVVSAIGETEASAFRRLGSNEAHLFSLRGAAFSRDCRWIALLGIGSARLFATTAGVKQEQSFSSDYGIEAVAFWPDGERFLLARASQGPTQTELVSGGVRFSAPAAFELVACRIGSPEELWTFALDDRPGPLGISPDGKWIAASARNRQQLFLLDAATGRCVDRLDGIEGMGWPDGDLRLAFSEDSDKLAFALSNGTVLVWNVADGRFVATLFRPERQED
jgi:WD40 repeat protein